MSDSTSLYLLSLSVSPPSWLFASLHHYLSLSWLMWADGLYQCFIHNPNNICLCLHFWKSKSTPDTMCWQRIHTMRRHTHTETHTLIINGLFLKVKADKTKMLYVDMWGNILICMCACSSASHVCIYERHNVHLNGCVTLCWLISFSSWCPIHITQQSSLYVKLYENVYKMWCSHQVDAPMKE